MLIAALGALALTISPDTGPQAAVDLSWLEGRWRACADGRETVEVWSRADDGLLFGHSVTRRGGRIAQWEQLRIVTRDGVTLYQAMPGGRTAADFVLVDQGPEGAVFENRENDWPNIMVYERHEAGLTATVRGLDGEDEPEMRWDYSAADGSTGCG
ncbi:MAG: hypothetical protein ACI8U3_001678 [Brevundimonas sp.]|jgi:hypothetical protein|uniref:DUF6265 family protein n=1 Tax=Brevundimonas sp. TaxID=1871086 RepID=UPI0039E3A29C